MKKAGNNLAGDGRRPAGRKRSRKETLEELKRQVVALDPWMAKIFELVDSIPAEAWKKVSRDLSYNLDHYIYGAPKRKR